MEKLIANIASNKVRSASLHGRSYLVAPVSMLVAGVWKGSAGSIYYDEKDIASSVPAWNNKPITIGHPERPDGTKVSGATPECLERFAVGMVLNTKFNKRSNKLQAEAWFDVQRLSEVEGAEIVHSALLAGQKLEVSTGLYVDPFVANGTFNGQSYEVKATNYRPDHLAIILSGEGACSLRDGAGLLVNKAATPARPEAPPQLVGNAKELTSIVDKVQTAVRVAYEVIREGASSTYAYVEAIYSNYVIFMLSTQSESTYFRQNYAIESGLVKLIGNATPVTRKVTYSVQNQKQDNMEREDLIKKLGSEHAEFVTNISEDAFRAIEKALASASTPPASAAPAKIVCNSVADLLEYAADGVKNQINDALQLAVSTREALIEKIIANTKNSFTKDELASYPTAHLNKLASVIMLPTQKANQGVYAGEAFVGNQGSQEPSKESVVLPIPTYQKKSN